ncbi:unnamed protein product [Discula destructiva]
MFGSRKNRPPNSPLNASTVSPSAATAALTAFRRDSTLSNSSLSAAAAAAALRARPTSPTDVASVQTQRTIRRSASASSSSNSTSNHRRGSSPYHLTRQPSTGSMTERTFRSPSPGPRRRSQSSGGLPRTPYTMDEAPPPPVPAIPESVNMAAARARGERPKSLGLVTTPVRTASQKMAEKGKGGSWFGAATVGDLGNVRTSDASMTIHSTRTPVSAQPAAESPPPHEEAQSESGGSSVNFSYPARLRVASPTRVAEEDETAPPKQTRQAAAPKPKKRSSTISPQRGGSVRSARPASIASDRELVYDPNSRRMVPRADLEVFDHHVQTAAETRPKKKKSALNRAGSHLAAGTMGRARGSAVDTTNVPSAAQMAAAASLRSHRVEAKQQVTDEQEEYYQEEAETGSSSELQMASTERPAEPEPRMRRYETSTSPDIQHDSGLQRRPSVVREEVEESEASEAERETLPNAAAALDAVPVRHSIYVHGVPSPPQSENTDDVAPTEFAATSRLSPDPILEKPEPRETQSLRRTSRGYSNSPVRSAHFGPVQETLTVKHEPPVRALSPRKSALKQSPSRGASPIGDRSDMSGTDTPTQEPPPPRKKSVRVSFDDENTVVLGEAAGRAENDSPVPPSPQQVTSGGKKPWYSSLGIGRKKDAVPLEEDEVMKPRPALPSFGSVRARKVSPRPDEERALVRPHDPLEGISETSSPELERRKLASEGPGQSSDHALGAIINDQGSRTGANISKQREPLPPIVTSIEGSGYASDSATSEEDSANLAEQPKLSTEESVVSQASTLVQPSGVSTAEQRTIEVKDFGDKHNIVPSISLTQPSPQPEIQGKERESYLRFPGGFPETETETESDGESHSSPARQAAFEPVVQKGDATATIHTPATVLATQTAVHEPELGSDESSIYSDAYEDLSEAEGDGYLSLDAVVDSPIIKTPPKHVLEKAHAQRPESTTPTPQSRRTGDLSISEPGDQWAAAKAYWRSLTSEKRAQLEKEAADEAGTEADLEEDQPIEEPRRKKSVEKRNAEKRTMEQRRVVDPSRTYMIQPGTKAGSIGSIDTDAASKSKAAAPRRDKHQQSDGRGVESGMRLRKTMRPSAEPKPVESATHFRQSMRASHESQPVESGTHMRKTMRSGPVQQPAPRQRPISHQPLGTTNESSSNKDRTNHTRTKSESASVPASVFPPSLRRRGSDSSASSFKRARPATQAGGFAFRKTMRASADGGASLALRDSRDQQRDAGSRLSMARTASPPVSMRRTLRGERRRSDDSGTGYLRFPGRSGKSEKKARRTSRFGDDSSDEDDEAVGRRFTSRFNDSSDEDLAPAKPQPSLGSKTMRAGHKGAPSPPLPEEEELSDADLPGVAGGSDDKTPDVTLAGAGRSSLGGQRQRRSSFISSVLRRNKKYDSGGKISRPELVESAARRDTTLERTSDELAAVRSGGARQAGASSPKLQKRIAAMPISRINTNNSQQKDWPLTPTADAVDEDQDVFYDAADGAGDDVDVSHQRSPSVLGQSNAQSSVTRPGFMLRRKTTASATEDGGEKTSGGGNKKKKFGTLRRMFRLDE